MQAISIEPVDLDDLSSVRSVFDDLRTYSMRVDGTSQRDGAANAFATALPSGHVSRHKHAFLARHKGVAVGLLDVIGDYPSPGIAFIGLLAVRETLQGVGLGRALFAEAERFIREDLEARAIRLAIVEANPVIGFWQKMGFSTTGEVKPFTGEAETSRVILMEKAI